VIIMHDAVAGPSGTVCFIAALRWLWLLPDWLAKWQSLVAYRRGLRRRDQADLRRGTSGVRRADQPAGPSAARVGRWR
jgi:hypothetical protein